MKIRRDIIIRQHRADVLHRRGIMAHARLPICSLLEYRRHLCCIRTDMLNKIQFALTRGFLEVDYHN